MIPFNCTAKTLPITLTAGAATTAVDLPEIGSTLRVLNSTGSPVFVAVSNEGTSATAPSAITPNRVSTPCFPGETPLGIGNDKIKMISIYSSVGGTVYVQVGEGI